MDEGLKVRLDNDLRSFDQFDATARLVAIETLVEGMARVMIKNSANKAALEEYVMGNSEALHDLDDKLAAHALFTLWRAIKDPNQG